MECVRKDAWGRQSSHVEMPCHDLIPALYDSSLHKDRAGMHGNDHMFRQVTNKKEKKCGTLGGGKKTETEHAR